MTPRTKGASPLRCALNFRQRSIAGQLVAISRAICGPAALSRHFQTKLEEQIHGSIEVRSSPAYLRTNRENHFSELVTLAFCPQRFRRPECFDRRDLWLDFPVRDKLCEGIQPFGFHIGLNERRLDTKTRGLRAIGRPVGSDSDSSALHTRVRTRHGVASD